MRMSCNGCRVLRKGCSEDCTLRPSLQWIDSTDAQSNATLFLAKYYGRAGLVNLINAGPTHQRGEVFQSLLYEACGRIINPVYGSAGLMSSGEWHRCQAAVEAVMAGAPLYGGHHSDTSSHRPRVRKSRKSRAAQVSEELSPEVEGVFTITGWEGDHQSHDSWSVEDRENGAGGIGLELTLGSDEREQNWR